MTTNDDMIARLPKDRQDKINKAVEEEVKRYTHNESISTEEMKNLNNSLEKLNEDEEELSDYVKELIKPENLIGPFNSTEDMMKSLWDEED